MKRFQLKKKNCFTLLETLIAMSLLSLLLVVIFGFFREMSIISNITEEKQKEAFKLRHVESRFLFLFERIVNDKEKNTRKFFFYCDPPQDTVSKFPSLIMTYNNEIRADPDFSGDVLARLYVDNSNNLCLITWPYFFEEQPQNIQQEILCQNVTDLAFKFYAAPPRLNSKNFIDPGKIDPNTPERDRWYENEWLQVFKEMPSIIHIHLEIEDKPENSNSSKKNKKESRKDWEFAFVLPSRKYPLYYPPS